MFVLGALLCALLGAAEDAFDWAVRKIRRALVVAISGAGDPTPDRTET